MMSSYGMAVQRLGWLLDGVEQWLQTQPEGEPIRRSQLKGIVPGRRATADELAVALTALAELRIVEKVGESWFFRLREYERSKGYRLGIREGLRVANVHYQSDQITLVAAVPPTMDADTRQLILRETADLRLAVFDLIASSERRVVLASPFWDEETVDDLHSLLSRRIADGVKVFLLGRAIGGSSASGQALATLVERFDPVACRAVTWFRASEGDRFGSETFHFKAAVVDGTRAYLGTANFTVSSLRSRMEMGVIVSGKLARSLDRILDVALTR